MARDKDLSLNPVGRPAKPMPPPIPDTPENVAKAILFTPPKPEQEWEYLSERDKDEPVQSDSQKLHR